MGPQQLILNQIVKAKTNIICVTIKLTNTMFPCQYCNYVSKRRYDVKRHEKALHKNGTYQDYGFQNSDLGVPTQQDRGESLNFPLSHKSFDIRLKENFKMFVSGPSRCGKTVFVSKLLEKIHAFAKIPPAKVLYIYKVWQPKYDEIMSLGVNFMEDSDNIVNDIKSSVSGQPMLVIFDNLIGSLSLKVIADLFTVDARHMNMSLVFLTQRMFVNKEAFRQISQNCNYFVIFKNPRNSSEIRTLAQHMTPGNMILVQIYMEATKGPFSYLFINLTHECDEKFKFLSHLFDNIGRVNVYIVEEQTYRKEVGYGKFNAIAFKNNNNEDLIQFIPYQDRTYNQEIYHPRLSNTTHINIPQENFNDGQVVNNIPPKNSKVETIRVNSERMQYVEAGTNTNLANNRFTQTHPMLFSEAGTNTNLPSNRYAQTKPMQYSEAGINTNLPSQISNQNYSCKCEDDDVEMNQMGIQYRSDFARQPQKSEVTPNQQPLKHTERPRQTESSTIYHIPQESISHTPIQSIQHNQASRIQSIQPPALEYRQTHGIENMETDAIDYHTQ